MSSGRKLGLLQDLLLLTAAVGTYSIFHCKEVHYWDMELTTTLKNVSIYYLIRYAFQRIDSEGTKESSNRKSAAAAVLRRLDRADQDGETNAGDGRNRRTRKEDLALNQYEQLVAMDVVASEDIPVSFEGKSIYFLIADQS
jgi:hypothetical protein